MIVYNVSVVQNEEPIEFYENVYIEDGKDFFEVLFPEDSTEPAQVIVVVTSFGTARTSMNERVVFNIVP